MKSIWEKLQLIFLPFLLLGVSFILSYSLLNWLIFIEYRLVDLPSELINFYIPLILSIALSAVFLKPRIKLLKFKSKNTSFYYVIISTLLIFFPNVFVQNYLEKTTGKLTELENISSIDKQKKTKYYTVKNYYIAKQDAETHITVETIEKQHHTELGLYLYITLPIYDSFKERKKANPAWLGISYFKKISNHLSLDEKEKEFNAFINESQEDLNSKDFHKLTYLTRIGSSSDLNEFKEALKKSSKYNDINDIVLTPSYTSFQERADEDFSLINIFSILAIFIWFVMLLIPRLDENKLIAFSNKHLMHKADLTDHQEESELKEFLSFFWPSREFFVTPIMANLCIIVFVIMVCSEGSFFAFKSSALLRWGANYAPYIEQGEHWRLLTSGFLHDGLQHLVLNVMALLFVGAFVEPILGKFKFTLIYGVLLVGASFASFYWHGAISVGASGAILGLFGLSLVLLLLTQTRSTIIKTFLFQFMSIFVIFTLLWGFISSGIDNAAHIGGLLIGCLAGGILALQKRKSEQPLPR